MATTDIKSRQAEAAQLYERGVAAARGGQRRVAAGLLSRAVQLDPQHEQAWLWLSGVLDDPNQVAFCLRTALTINPSNQRAQQGLAWLEQRKAVTTPVSPVVLRAAPAATETNGHTNGATRDGAWWRLGTPRAQPVPQPNPARSHDSWWVNWRRSHHELRRGRLFMWLAPILLLLLTLGLNLALRDAVARNAALVRSLVVPEATAMPTAETPAVVPTPTPEPILALDLRASDDAQAIAYLSAIQPVRNDLGNAVEVYRSATSQPGNSSVVHAAAARTLRSQVEAGHDIIAALKPPRSLADAHKEYLAGLADEMAALDDMLEFYGSFSVQLANRATIRMDGASRRMDLVRKTFSQRLQQTLDTTRPQQTAR